MTGGESDQNSLLNFRAEPACLPCYGGVLLLDPSCPNPLAIVNILEASHETLLGFSAFWCSDSRNVLYPLRCMRLVDYLCSPSSNHLTCSPLVDTYMAWVR